MAFGDKRGQAQAPSSAGDTVLELLKAAADPNSAKRVKELLDATKAYESKVAEARDFHAEADRKLQYAHQVMGEAKTKEVNTAAWQSRLQNFDTELSEKKRNLDGRENELAQRERAAAEHHRQLYTSIDAHNADKLAWGKEAAALRSKLQADRDALEKRIKEARAFLQL